MIKHASSHGLAVLICTVISALLIELLKGVFPSLHAEVLSVCAEFVANNDLSIEPSMIATVIIAVGLGLIWGIAFKFAFKN